MAAQSRGVSSKRDERESVGPRAHLEVFFAVGAAFFAEFDGRGDEAAHQTRAELLLAGHGGREEGKGRSCLRPAMETQKANPKS